MSVVVLVRIPVADVAKAVEALDGHAALLDEITEDAKALGAIHHRFAAGDGEMLVIDEWGDAGQFEGFFADNAKVGQVMAAAGVAGPPEVSIYSPVEAAGTF
jgi:hypothetical protein